MNEQKHMKCCPACNSDQIKKASLIAAEGVGVSIGGLVGSAGVNAGIGLNASALALRAAPPKRGSATKNLFWLLFIWANGFVFGPQWFGLGPDSDFAGWWVLGGIAAIWGLIATNRSEAKQAHEKAMAEYQKVFMCLRCGTFYKPYED